jgi:lipoprotein-anchoring transpeptidase ErfK/SrfK
MVRIAGAMLSVMVVAGPASAGPPTPQEVVQSAFVEGWKPAEDAVDPLVLKAQVLLDRARFSPGVIDGYDGENFRKALSAFEEQNGLAPDGVLDAAVWTRLSAVGGGDVLVRYTITDEDAAGPFEPDLPEDYDRLAKLDALSFTGVREMLAERFHMDEDLLAALNAGARFEAGDAVIVAAPDGPEAEAEVDHVEVSLGGGWLRAYSADGGVVLFQPASVGSKELPSPKGTHAISAVVLDPDYTYRPDVNFKQGDVDETLVLPPGPNNPVGSVWIDLTEPTYGIHGTPSPSKIDKLPSHGCVRLTNWDARELADLVHKGDTVAFVE